MDNSNYGIQSINSSCASLPSNDDNDDNDDDREGGGPFSDPPTVDAPPPPDDDSSPPGSSPSSASTVLVLVPMDPSLGSSATSLSLDDPQQTPSLPSDAAFPGPGRPARDSPSSDTPPFPPPNAPACFLARDPRTPPSPSPPLLSSWTTPLSSSVSSLAPLTPDVQRSPSARTTRSSHDTDSSASLDDDHHALDQRSSNGNLILPTIPSLSSTLRDPGEVARVGEGRTRFALVGAEEAGREWLVGRLEEVFAVVGGWKRFTDEVSGRVLVGEEEKEVVLTLHSVETESIQDLDLTIKNLHSPLLQQLAPLVGGLGLPDLVDLARTGKGRGPGGWVDCVLVLVDQEKLEETLLAAAHLAQIAPTLLLAPPSLNLPSVNHLAPFLNPSSFDLTTSPSVGRSTVSLLALDPLRAILTKDGRQELARSAGEGFGRHLSSFLSQPVHVDGLAREDDDEDGEGMDSSIHTSLYSYIPPSPLSHSFFGTIKDCPPSLPPSAQADFDPLFLPTTVYALAHLSARAWRARRAQTWTVGWVALSAAAGLCVWGVLSGCLMGWKEGWGWKGWWSSAGC